MVCCDKRGYGRNEWLTYKQSGEKGAHVRKGEKGTYIVYMSTYKKDQEKEGYRFLKTFNELLPTPNGMLEFIFVSFDRNAD